MEGTYRLLVEIDGRIARAFAGGGKRKTVADFETYIRGEAEPFIQALAKMMHADQEKGLGAWQQRPQLLK